MQNKTTYKEYQIKHLETQDKQYNMSIQELNRERQAYISLLFNQFKIDEYNFGVPRKDFSSTSSNSTRNRKR